MKYIITLLSAGDENESYLLAKQKLTTYFEPKVNLTYEAYNFRSIKQESGEAFDVVRYTFEGISR